MATEPTVSPNVLVVGAASGGSLGEAIVNTLAEYDFGNVSTAGITDEMYHLDVLQPAHILNVLEEVGPDIVVCTVGINEPADIGDAFLAEVMEGSFAANVTGPMNLLRHFVVSPVRPERGDAVKKFVAISSNSARIARRNSIAYCASKAALSMALRVAARELAGRSVAVWGYEPGLLAGTPMSREAAGNFASRQGREPEEVIMHRMPGVPPEGLPVKSLAQRVVHDLATFSYAHNGTIVQFDAGEQ